MDDEADVKRIVDIINIAKQEQIESFQYHEEFIGSDDDSIEFIEESSVCSDYPGSLLTPSEETYINDPVSILTSNEKIIVDSCQNPDLKKLLLLNRTKNMQLIKLYKRIKDLLMECKYNIEEKNKLIKTHEVTPRYQRYSSTGGWRLGAPYFKDKSLFACPPNPDTLRKKENCELTTYDLTPIQKWAETECKRLLSAVKLNYSLNRQTEIKRQLNELTNSLESENVKDAKFKELTAKLQELKDNNYSEVPPYLSDENINWGRISDQFLKNKHSEAECRSFWHLYVHPAINKQPWTKTENNKLKMLVTKYKCQDWTSIVRELGTNRTVFTACINYFVNMSDKYRKGEFTYAEDKKIVDLVRHYKMGSYIPWIKISEHFKDRTRTQLHHRYTCYLNEDHKKRGRFTDAEDLLLLMCVDKYGKRFRKCQEHLPHRQQIQLKSRYNTNLQFFLKKGSWKLEDDQMLVKHVEEYGTKNWAPVSKKLERSRGQCRQRYLVVHYFLKKGGKIENVPRRRHQYKKEEEKYFVLRSIADEFRDRPIPTLKEAEKLLKDRNVMHSSSEDENEEEEEIEDKKETVIDTLLESIDPESEDEDPVIELEQEDKDSKDVDNWLTEYFIQLKEKPQRTVTSNDIKQAANSVELILNLLHARLNILEDFDMIPSLDNIDVAILMNLLQRKSKNKSLKSTVVVPPSKYTARGLYNLINRSSKNKQPHRSIVEFAKRHPNTRCPLKSTVDSELLQLNLKQRAALESDRNLFFQRFHSLFKFPALMSCDQPMEDLENITEYYGVSSVSVKRTYSKANPIFAHKDGNIVKKVKLPELKMPDTSSILTLTPVTDKSIIETLLKDQSKKLFTLDKVQEQGKVRAVIREVKFPVNTPTTTSVDVKNSVASYSRASSSKPCPATVTSCSNRKNSSNATEDGRIGN